MRIISRLHLMLGIPGPEEDCMRVVSELLDPRFAKAPFTKEGIESSSSLVRNEAI